MFYSQHLLITLLCPKPLTVSHLIQSKSHSPYQWLTRSSMIWPYPPPLTHFSGFIHYFPPFHSAPASLAFLLSLEQIGHCSYIKFFALAVPMPRTSFLQSLMDFLILICIFSQISLSVKSSLDNLSKLQYSSSLMFCDPFFPNIFSLYHSSRRTICFPFFPLPSIVSKINRCKPQNTPGPEQLQIHRPENFKKRTPENLGGRQGSGGHGEEVTYRGCFRETPQEQRLEVGTA